MLVNECDPKYSKWQGDQVCWQAMEKINKVGGNKLDHDYKSSVRCGAKGLSSSVKMRSSSRVTAPES